MLVLWRRLKASTTYIIDGRVQKIHEPDLGDRDPELRDEFGSRFGAARHKRPVKDWNFRKVRHFLVG